MATITRLNRSSEKASLSSVGPAALVGPFLSSASARTVASSSITLPSVQSGMAFTIQNLGSIPLVIEAPSETISLDSLDTWRTE